ncbi:MAG: hypothetical protein ACREKI_02905, partial [Gemmatimonadota bacterium]
MMRPGREAMMMTRRGAPAWACALVIILLLPAGAGAQTAQYEADLSFPLPARGLPGGAEEPVAVEVGASGELHVLDKKTGKVLVFNERTQYRRSYPEGNGALRGAIAMALHASGNAFVLEGDARTVAVIGADGRRTG